MDEIKNTDNDALVLVYLRNEFYKTKYYFVLGVYLLSLIVILVLGGVLVFILKNPTHPLYFATDDVGRLIKDVPLLQPNMSTAEVSDWTVHAVEAAYSYDFINYRGQLQDAQKYFTNYGWYSYMNGLRASNNLLALSQRKMIIIAKVVDKPKLIIEAVLANAYAYKFEMPVLVSYLLPPYDNKPQSRFANPLLVSVIVQRQNILQSDKGLAILQMNATLVVTPDTQNLTQPIS